MKGLLKNNFYAAGSNGKAFAVVMLLAGLFVAAMDNQIPSLVIGYMLLSMIGFSLNSIASLRKESASKWSVYKLSLPVRRAEIVKSYYVSMLFWLAAGGLFASAVLGMSVLLHGFPFDRSTDVFTLYVIGIGVSLFMGAVFFPLFYLGGEERNEVFLVVSLLCGAGAVMGLATLVNTLFPAPMSTGQVVLSGGLILACGVVVFFVSCLVAVGIFSGGRMK